MDKAGQIWQQIMTALAEMSMVRKISIVMTIGISIFALAVLGQISSHSGYQILYSNLKSDDISQIATALDKYHVSYQVQSETQSILVPGDKVLETRLKLARENLPKLGGVGYEIFDQKSFGMTEFEQHLNYQRALQGELIRTINELEEIEDSRVHLVIPEQSVFAQDRQSPTASIVVKLASGQKISEETVQSIVHLVSASVPNLLAKDVTVVDTSGQLLSSSESEAGSIGGESAGALRKKRDVENGYESKIKSLLEPIIGMGRVQVRVTADLNFTSKETTEEKYDPESVAVRSEKRTKLNEAGGSADSGGVAGANTQASASGGSSKNKNESSEDINYEISKQIQRIVEPLGGLNNMSVAVLVDGTNKPKDDGTTEYVPRTPEELKNYEDIVKSAIGFNEKRGDQLKVMNMAFQSPDSLFTADSGAGAFWEKQNSYSFYISLAINIVIAIIALLIILFVVRPVLAAWNARRLAMGGEGGLALDAAGKPMLDRGKMRGDLQKQALDDPESMVKILRAWLE